MALNRYQGLKLDLIKSLRACLDQNKVEEPKLDFCKTWGTKNALNSFLKDHNALKYEKVSSDLGRFVFEFVWIWEEGLYLSKRLLLKDLGF
jgi:hypothetical protein